MPREVASYVVMSALLLTVTVPLAAPAPPLPPYETMTPLPPLPDPPGPLSDCARIPGESTPCVVIPDPESSEIAMFPDAPPAPPEPPVLVKKPSAEPPLPPQRADRPRENARGIVSGRLNRSRRDFYGDIATRSTVAAALGDATT